MRLQQPSGRRAAAAALPILLASLAAGCGGDGLPREAVSGEVLIDGQPLKSGIITFVPAEPTTPTTGGTTVDAGKFAIPRAAGLVPGKYKVVISSGEGSQEKPVENLDEMLPGMPPTPATEVVPPQYSGNSVLEATVTAGGDNIFAYTLNKGGR